MQTGQLCPCYICASLVFFAHGFLPESMLSVVLVPMIKDKAGKIYPIALASVFSKLIEVIIPRRIEIFLGTNPNQIGFKKKHGTDQCVYVFKEIIALYRTLNGSLFVCFLDASKAFDIVNHRTLFKNLSERGVPVHIQRILIYLYHNETSNQWC